MCGRYVAPGEEDVADCFDVKHVTWHEAGSMDVRPTDLVGIVIEDTRGDPWDGRQLRPARWGLVPSWTKALSSRPLINARAETLFEKPSFRVAASRRRAIVPALGYYEWTTSPSGKKTPLFLHPPKGGVIGFAGVYEWRRVPEGVEMRGIDEDRRLYSMAIVTRPAMDGIGQLHDRMPVVVTPELVADWLDPTGTRPDVVTELLAAMPDPVLVVGRDRRELVGLDNGSGNRI